MNKGRVIGLLKQHGDAILTTINPTSRELKHNLCTIEFKNKYIKNRTRGKKPWPKNKTEIVVFDWTEDRYWILDPTIVKKITPLAEVLKNVGPPVL